MRKKGSFLPRVHVCVRARVRMRGFCPARGRRPWRRLQQRVKPMPGAAASARPPL